MISLFSPTIIYLKISLFLAVIFSKFLLFSTFIFLKIQVAVVRRFLCKEGEYARERKREERTTKRKEKIERREHCIYFHFCILASQTGWECSPPFLFLLSVWLLHVASCLCNTCFVHQPNEMLMHLQVRCFVHGGLSVPIMNVVSKEGHLA